MPVVSIKLAGKLTRAQKKAIAEEITATLEKHADKPARYTYIAFEVIARRKLGDRRRAAG